MKYSELSFAASQSALRCDAKMWLTDIEPGAPGQQKLVFDCLGCGDQDSFDLKISRHSLSPASQRGSAMPDWLGFARRTH